MRPRTIMLLYVFSLCAFTVFMFILRSQLTGADYYRAARTQTLVYIEFAMLGGSIFLWRRLCSAFSSVYCPSSVGENGNFVLLPFGDRWRQICLADVIRSAVTLFLILAHLSFLFYYTWLGPEPNVLALLSLAATGLYIHLLVFVGFVEIWYQIGRVTRKRWLSEVWGLRWWLGVFYRRRDQLTLWAAVVAFLLVLGGLHTTLSDPVVKRIDVPVKHLPADFSSSVRIALLTDVHIGPSVGRKRVEKIVEVTNSLNPDLVAISGDLADGFVSNLREAAEPLCSLRSKHGVFFATGNHEYMHGNVDEWFDFLRQCNITVLHNEHRRLPLGEGASMCIAGVDDLQAARSHFPGHGMDVQKALSGCRKGEVQVLLAHQPNAARHVIRTGLGEDLDLILSGHTHAGQMYMFYPVVWLANAYTRGLYHDRRTDTHVLVSAGVNYFGPPVKMFGMCEILDVVLSPFGREPLKKR